MIGSLYIAVMSETSPPVLTVASYNIRKARGTDRRHDPARSLATSSALDADIVVLQEADFRLGHRPTALPRPMIADLTGLEPIEVAGHPDSLGWHGIAILARRGLKTVDVDCIDLPGLEPRGAVLADLDCPLGPLRVVGVHLGLLRRNRRQQIDHLRQALGAKAPRPTLILGDFNEWSLKRGLGRMARDYLIVTPGPSFPSRLPLLPLDRIAHSPDLRVDPTPPVSGRVRTHPSDHLPIRAEVRTA